MLSQENQPLSVGQALLQKLEGIEKKLDLLTGPKLGPIARPSFFDSRKLYCNRSNNCPWYEYIDNIVIPFPHEALLGFLREIKFEQVERRGKDTWKIHILVEADTLYLLEAGYDSFFSRGFLLGVSQLTPEQIRQPIAIYPEPGDGDEVLFCRLYLNGRGQEYVKTPSLSKDFISGTNWKDVATKAMQLVVQANQ